MGVWLLILVAMVTGVVFSLLCQALSSVNLLSCDSHVIKCGLLLIVLCKSLSHSLTFVTSDLYLFTIIPVTLTTFCGIFNFVEFVVNLVHYCSRPLLLLFH